MRYLFFLLLILLLLLTTVNLGRADEYEDLEKEKAAKQAELQKIQEDKTASEKKKGTIVGTLSAVGTQLENVNSQLSTKKKEIQSLEVEIREKGKEREEKAAWRDRLLRAWYKNFRTGPLELFLGAGNFSDFAHKFSGYKSVVLEGERQVNFLNTYLVSLGATLGGEQKKKAKIEGEVAALATQRSNLTAEKTQVESVLSNLTSQIAVVESAISGLTARQDELIRQKLSATAFFTSVGETAQVKEMIPEAPFSPAFAVVSIGYPHRVGLSQYGAFGRAKAGQSFSTILNAYYQNFSLQTDYPVPATIEVEGYGRIPFEENYLYGIAEMPTKWAEQGGYEALRAQAIAARSYALAATGNGASPICPTPWCQVYNPGKVGDPAAARWRDAVRETRNWVMVNPDGSPVKAYYASTAGGYTRLPNDFDVRWNYTAPFLKRIHDADGEGKAYDGPSYGDSPWYYKAWYSKAQDLHPWLTKDEMTDLLNASLLPDDYNQYLSNESDGGWSAARVREALHDKGISAVDNLNSVQPLFSEPPDEGYTARLCINGSPSNCSLWIDGKRFRKVFTLRSRGSLALWSSLYDIIKR